MALSRRDIIARIQKGDLVFAPPVPLEAVRQVSVDLTLDRVFTKFKPKPYLGAVRITPDLFMADDMWEVREEDEYVLGPQKFVLAQTAQRVTLPNDLMGFIEGRSSWARLGISIHITAPKIDPGFSNHIKLEMHNHTEQSVILVPGMSPCQLILMRISRPLKDWELYGSGSEDIFQHASAKRATAPSTKRRVKAPRPRKTTRRR